MSDPIYVTDIAERKRIFLGGLKTHLDILYGDDETGKWWSQFGEKMSFTFKPKHFYGKGACKLYYKLVNAIKERDEKVVREILPEMKKHCQKDYEDLSPVERWKHAAVQLPGDIGGPRKKEIRDLITSKSNGKVLETMCGFNSYFGKSLRITEIIALDFCKEMLERYVFPERKRILYDLEKIVNGDRITFFNEEEFQTIGCWGSNYLSNPVSVFTEFHRIISLGGNLLVLESTSEGYHDLVKRFFKPNECSKFMQDAGFSTEITHLDWLKTEWELGEYYLVEGKKQ